jgi:hypothetical protein
MLTKPNQGQLAEYFAATELLELGYPVAQPMVDRKYDLLVETDDGFSRIQVKKGSYFDQREDQDYPSVRVNLRPTTKTEDLESYSKDDIDAFIVHNPEHRENYLLWVEDAPDYMAGRKLSSWRDHLLSSVLGDQTT